MTDVKRGAPYAEEAYAQSKMLDHSCWQEGEQSCWDKDAPRLPRLVTPSDLDTVFCRLMSEPNAVPCTVDDRGKIIFAELTRQQGCDWRLLSGGQFKLYRGLLDGPHVAVLCRHTVDVESRKKICTRHDILSFQPMLWDHGNVFGPIQHSNSQWQQFVIDWFADALRVRRRILGYDAGLRPIVAVK